VKIEYEKVEPKQRNDYKDVYENMDKITVGKPMIIDPSPYSHTNLYNSIKGYLQRNKKEEVYNVGIRNKKVFIERI
jgi:hypothetical protein